jgi:hypothetical protein
MSDPDAQAEQITDAQRQIMAEEARYSEMEGDLDEETAEAEAETDEE